MMRLHVQSNTNLMS